MIEQYLRLKKEHEDALLLFRMGDFYETFFEDAKLASKVLGLTLTARNHGKGESIPLAGVPHHALDSYLSRLIKAGVRVAICEQMEDPKQAKGIVKRDVVEVVSPGTALSEGLLDQRRNNFLLGLCGDEKSYGLCVADLSTGEFLVSEVPASSFWDEIEQTGPAEVLAPQGWVDAFGEEFKTRFPSILLTRAEDWTFGYEFAYDALREHFGVASLKGFDADDLTAGVRAAGGVLTYLRDNQRASLAHIGRLSRRRSAEYMVLDSSTQRNLELIASLREDGREGTLISVLDRTKTPMGARMLRTWLTHPLRDASGIRRRLDAVEEFVSDPGGVDEIAGVLREVGDVERMLARVCCGRASPRDVVGLKDALNQIPRLRACLENRTSELLRRAREKGMPDLSEVTGWIEEAVVDDPPMLFTEGGIFRDGYHEELDELRGVRSGGQSWVARLQAQERERTGIGSLKVGYTRAFGYYIEVTRANQSKVPEDYIQKQTLVNAMRYITPDLKEWEAKILGAEERINELERDLFVELRSKVAERAREIQTAARAIAGVDVLTALADVALMYDYARPEVDESEIIDIKEGRHPSVERLIPEGEFVPNDAYLDRSQDQVLIITGPNMAGKSTFIRQLGLIVLLAQIGSFVPAQSARIGVVDRIFTRVGASDNLARGESTFLVEMNEAANILNNATDQSLVLLDEVGRGTSTFDGLSIAWAMTEYLHNTPKTQPRTLFATHYHELTELEDTLSRVRNYNVAVRERGDQVVFLRKIVPGGCDHSYGIHVAQLAGLPREVIERATEVLKELEQNGAEPDKTPKRRRGRVPQVDERQMSLFMAPQEPPKIPHWILEELKEMNVSSTTPLQALLKLDEWQRRIGEEDSGDGVDRRRTDG